MVKLSKKQKEQLEGIEMMKTAISFIVPPFKPKVKISDLK